MMLKQWIPALLGLLLISTGLANEPLSGVWVAQGPGPATGGQTENVVPNNEVVGALEAVIAHPSNPDILWVGGVNAGIWKTTNATASSPNWTHQTDLFDSLSIGGLDLDPFDTSHQTLVAGIGRFSSYGRQGGSRIGLLRTTDGGNTWSVIDGGGAMVGRNVAAVAARGNVILAAVNVADVFSFPNFGIFRSTNTGASFTQISGAAGTGLPGGVTHDLGKDPTNSARLFTSVIFAGANNGVYRSTDNGATWAKVSNAAMDALITDEVRNIEFSIGLHNNVYVAIVGQDGRLSGVFRSGNGGDSWTAMQLPTTIEGGGAQFGIHPGGQGSIHLSILADPTDPNIVYVGGDRQPFFSEGGGSGFWPNSLGARDFSGRLFRGNAAAQGQQWTPLTHVGTASNSSPHADSREMVFDAAGNLIQVDDGGIYKRTSPRTASGDWFSLNGDLQATEYHGIAYDANAGIIIGGAQDIGTTEQLVPDGTTYRSVSTADGGDVAVEIQTTPGLATRYSSFQNLGAFRRRVVNASNVVQSQVFPSLTPLGDDPAIQPQFYTPIVANPIDGNRLLIGANNGLYESLNQGDTVTRISAVVRVNAFVGDPVIYGVPGDPNLIYAADGPDLWRRSGATTNPVVQVTSPTASTINGLTINPGNPNELFIVDAAAVWRSTNAAGNWSDISNDLSSLNPGRLRALAFAPASDSALIVGADRGIFVAYASSGYTNWTRLGGTNLPNAPVYELAYSAVDDVLVAGTLGRGAWKLSGAADVIFADRFRQ